MKKRERYILVCRGDGHSPYLDDKDQITDKRAKARRYASRGEARGDLVRIIKLDALLGKNKITEQCRHFVNRV